MMPLNDAVPAASSARPPADGSPEIALMASSPEPSSTSHPAAVFRQGARELYGDAFQATLLGTLPHKT
jgi:hypothetical protein